MKIRLNKNGYWERIPKNDTLKIVLVTLITANAWLLAKILQAIGII